MDSPMIDTPLGQCEQEEEKYEEAIEITDNKVFLKPKMKKKTGPKGPVYPGGCYNNPNSKSYRPNKGVGRGKVKNKVYKNKMYEKITIQEYAELKEYKQKYLEITGASDKSTTEASVSNRSLDSDKASVEIH